MKHKSLKQTLRKLLSNPNLKDARRRILEFPLKQVVSPLISFLYAGDEALKWRSVTMLGTVVSELADTDMEAGRVIMRRLLWNLNDESGGIGWGSPEALGEIMAQNEALAKEYSAILISYIREDCNYIEHQMLQRGVLWGIGRLAHARPECVENAVLFLAPYITADDPVLRGLAMWIARALPSPLIAPYIEKYTEDYTAISIYLNDKKVECSISRLAKEALSDRHFPVNS